VLFDAFAPVLFLRFRKERGVSRFEGGRFDCVCCEFLFIVATAG